jgi:hypothetical protein
VTADEFGHVRFVGNFSVPPFNGIPGAHRYLQFLYDDPAGGGAGFNLSEAVDVAMCQ